MAARIRRTAAWKFFKTEETGLDVKTNRHRMPVYFAAIKPSCAEMNCRYEYYEKFVSIAMFIDSDETTH